MLKELQLIGLSKNEAKVYEALVSSGPSKAGFLIIKLDIHRNIVYQSLESLVSQGYVTKVSKRGVWHYQITDPNSLLSSLKRKENILKEIIVEIKTHKLNSNQQFVVYEGVESYKSFWQQAIERMPEGSVGYVAGGTLARWEEHLKRKDYVTYSEIAKKKKIQWKQIYFDLNEREEKLLKTEPMFMETRVWEGTQESLPGNFNVLGDTVILQTLVSPPRIIEMRDEIMVELFQGLFDRLWEKAKPVVIA